MADGTLIGLGTTIVLGITGGFGTLFRAWQSERDRANKLQDELTAALKDSLQSAKALRLARNELERRDGHAPTPVPAEWPEDENTEVREGKKADCEWINEKCRRFVFDESTPPRPRQRQRSRPDR